MLDIGRERLYHANEDWFKSLSREADMTDLSARGREALIVAIKPLGTYAVGLTLVSSEYLPRSRGGSTTALKNPSSNAPVLNAFRKTFRWVIAQWKCQWQVYHTAGPPQALAFQNVMYKMHLEFRRYGEILPTALRTNTSCSSASYFTRQWRVQG